MIIKYHGKNWNEYSFMIKDIIFMSLVRKRSILGELSTRYLSIILRNGTEVKLYESKSDLSALITWELHYTEIPYRFRKDLSRLAKLQYKKFKSVDSFYYELTSIQYTMEKKYNI